VLVRNVVVPILGIADEARRLRLLRVGVAVLGAVALWLAVVATDVAALVEEASSFGNAGVLVVVSFALFTSFGGALAATTALVGALASYLGWTLSGASYPFTGSLLVALAGYVAMGWWERRRALTR
jgi:hypothetical protein